MNDNRSFIDTNIYAYSFDKSEEVQCKIAGKLIERLCGSSNAVISYQVIQEFYNLATGKFKDKLIHEDVGYFVKKIMYPYCEVFSSFELFDHALEISQRYKYGYYDSLIIAASIRSNCKFLYSEDLQDGQVIEGVEIVNPFI